MVRQADPETAGDRFALNTELAQAIPSDAFVPLSDEDELLVRRVHQRLIEEMDLKAVEDLGPDRSREAVEAATRTLVSEVAPGLFGERKELIVTRAVDDAIGLGPIQPLVDDPGISEVMVNTPDEVYFERDGIIYLSPLRFRDTDHIMLTIDRIISPLGRRVDESSPYVDARLPDGSRVNVIIPPLVPRSPAITIRKFRSDRYDIAGLVENGTLSAQVNEFLRVCVQLRLNIVISGGTGSGKTTFLNALSAFIPERERILTIEDPVELSLRQKHVISCEARPANIEGNNEVTQRDLVRNALRMRPDRIIVGEVRGPEAFDMMQAMNTGHDGSLTTVHANSPRDALSRIENMVLMSGYELPSLAIREQMASAFHLIMQLSRFADGSRRLTHVSEVVGMEGGIVTMQDLFIYEVSHIEADGRLVGEMNPTGIMPTFAERFTKAGIPIESIVPSIGSWA